MDFVYCLIKNKSSGLALDVSGANTREGAKIIVWTQHGNENQTWYNDPATGTIRSKMNDYCLDLKDGSVVLNPFKSGDENQQWQFHKNTIRNIHDHDKVLEIKGSVEAGAVIGSDEFDDKDVQLWDFEPVGGCADHMRPPLFYIVSELSGKVVDIERASEDEGAKVVMWEKGHEKQPNQLWYLDSLGNIRSSLNNMVFHSKKYGKKLKTSEYSNSKRHQWRVEEDKILNGDEESLDIRGGSEEDGAHLCSYRFHGKKNQLWRIEYV